MFGRKNTVKQAKERLLEEMAKYPQTSAEYSKLMTELEKLTKAEFNQNGWRGQLGVGIVQTAITAISSSINVWSVLKHEDRGNVITTKAMQYIKKP